MPYITEEDRRNVSLTQCMTVPYEDKKKEENGDVF